jgi:hypothetical protein
MLTFLLLFTVLEGLLYRNGVGWLGGNFGAIHSSTSPLVSYVIQISHKGLRFGAYSVYQMELSDKVLALRDIDRLTYKQIADQLIVGGYRSPRGFDLGPESVFSIYKKRKIRDLRLNAAPKLELKIIEIEEL